MDREKMIDAIANMTVLELSELVKAIEEKFGVSAVPMISGMVGGAVGGVAGADDAGVKEEKTSFMVELTSAGGEKIQVIKALREITSLGLKEAKDMADAAPKVIKEGASKEEAEEIKKKLEAVGATITIK